MAKTTWTMNDTQKAFMAEVSKYADGVTIFELKLAGHDFKSGSINTLISKGYVEVVGDREFACDVVYGGVVVGKTTKTGKIYKAVKMAQQSPLIKLGSWHAPYKSGCCVGVGRSHLTLDGSLPSFFSL